MAIRQIIEYSKNEAPLRRKSEPVRVVNRRIKNLIQDLKDTLDTRPEGIGLAAPQIDAHSRVIVVRLKSERNGNQETRPTIALINPEIIEAGRPERDFDGCLSFPGLYAETVRPHYLKVKGLDEWGKPFIRTFEGFDAVLVHHEIDHLDGILFIDRVTDLSDLYRVREDENGDWVRVPVTEEIS